MDLDDQVAIVTGGARGIGVAIAQALATNGAHVVCLDLDDQALAELKETTEGWNADAAARVEGRIADITDPEQVAAAVRGIAEVHGRIDILINNAGITGGAATPVWETSIERWHVLYDVLIHGTFYMMREVLPHMLGQGYGRIVNVASVAGKEGNPNSSAYSSAKAAVIGLTKSAGKELATTGVIVNAITPGVIETRMNKMVDPAHHEYLVGKIPMGRPGKPEEVAELVLWLASPRVSFSTGAVFDISGGRTTY